MKRFLIVLAVVAVAGATYVATAPGGQSAGPTAAQFKSLRKEVRGLKKQLGDVKHLLRDCMSSSAPITRRGDWQTPTGPTYGYVYFGPNPTAQSYETALDIAREGDTNVMWITGGTAKCGADVGTARRKLGLRR